MVLKKGRALKEELSNDTAGRENVHGRLQGRAIRIGRSGGNETLGGQVARTAGGSVEEERKVRAIADENGLVGRKVGEIKPAPGSEHEVFGFDVSMTNAVRVGLLERLQDLEGEPELLDGAEERSRGYSVQQIGSEILSVQKHR